MILLLRGFFAGALGCALTSITAGQGALAPTGAPAPTMKTLQQVEPRTPIGSVPFSITQNGSYYLTQNLQFTATSGHAITVAAADVTIDLMGFTLSSTSGVTGDAIHMEAASERISVKNGAIVGTTTVVISGNPPTATWTVTPGGFAYGVQGTNFSVVRCDHLFVARCRSSGIFAQPGSVTGCTTEENGAYGMITDSVVECLAQNNYSTGIGSDVVQTSRAFRNRLNGISAGIATNCDSLGNGGTGISASSLAATSRALTNGGVGFSAKSVIGCIANENTLHGIVVTGLAKDNQCAENGREGDGAGIYIGQSWVRVEGNNCVSNDWGIQSAAGTSSFIVRNSCRSNTGAPTNAGASAAYDFDRATNTYGPVLIVNGDMSTVPAASHPAANIQY